MFAIFDRSSPKPEAIMYAKCNGTISCCDLNERGTRLVAASRDAVSNFRYSFLLTLNNLC